MAVSNTMPKRRVVSGSNLSPSRYCLIGMSKTAARPGPQHGFCREHLSVGYRTKKPKKLVYFFSQGGEQDFAMVSWTYRVRVLRLRVWDEHDFAGG